MPIQYFSKSFRIEPSKQYDSRDNLPWEGPVSNSAVGKPIVQGIKSRLLILSLGLCVNWALVRWAEYLSHYRWRMCVYVLV